MARESLRGSQIESRAAKQELARRTRSVTQGYAGKFIESLSLERPHDLEEASLLPKILSKLSPIIANFLEYQITRSLNDLSDWPTGSRWQRQDPDFPDIILRDNDSTILGLEIKLWSPLATEITARFRESQRRLTDKEILIAVFCWTPQYVLFGRPHIMGVWIDNALPVAKSRDNHYHAPPRYVVTEPENTESRTRNLRQTNCLGYRFQGTDSELKEAEIMVASWRRHFAGTYDSSEEYQTQVRQLVSRFRYRLDTNFAKIDRISHASLEAFKTEMLGSRIFERPVAAWAQAITHSSTKRREEALAALMRL